MPEKLRPSCHLIWFFPTILFYHVFVLNWWVTLLIPAAITQIFNPIAELVIPTGILRKESKAEIEIHPVIVKAQKKKIFNIT